MPCHVWTALSLTDTLALYKKSITTKVSLCNGSSSLQCFWSRRVLLIPATSPVHGKTAKGGRRLKEPRIAWSRTRPFMFALYKPCQRYCIYLLLPIWGVQRVLNLLITHLLLPIWQAPSKQNISFIFSPACSRSMQKTPNIPFIFVQTVFHAGTKLHSECNQTGGSLLHSYYLHFTSPDGKASMFVIPTFYPLGGKASTSASSVVVWGQTTSMRRQSLSFDMVRHAITRFPSLHAPLTLAKQRNKPHARRFHIFHR